MLGWPRDKPFTFDIAAASALCEGPDYDASALVVGFTAAQQWTLKLQGMQGASALLLLFSAAKEQEPRSIRRIWIQTYLLGIKKVVIDSLMQSIWSFVFLECTSSAAVVAPAKAVWNDSNSTSLVFVTLAYMPCSWLERKNSPAQDALAAAGRDPDLKLVEDISFLAGRMDDMLRACLAGSEAAGACMHACEWLACLRLTLVCRAANSVRANVRAVFWSLPASAHGVGLMSAHAAALVLRLESMDCCYSQVQKHWNPLPEHLQRSVREALGAMQSCACFNSTT
eukprot:1158757-Pelagomonas_calceolata.AAC.5